MSDHRVNDSTLASLLADDPYVEIDNGQIVIVAGEQRVALPLRRNAPELAFLLCEAHDEIVACERPLWAERMRVWRRIP